MLAGPAASGQLDLHSDRARRHSLDVSATQGQPVEAPTSVRSAFDTRQPAPAKAGMRRAWASMTKVVVWTKPEGVGDSVFGPPWPDAVSLVALAMKRQQ